MGMMPFFRFSMRFFVHIQGDDPVAQVGKTRAGDQADIADADDTDLFHDVIPFIVKFGTNKLCPTIP